jgi:hypothetical protein
MLDIIPSSPFCEYICRSTINPLLDGDSVNMFGDAPPNLYLPDNVNQAPATTAPIAPIVKIGIAVATLFFAPGTNIIIVDSMTRTIHTAKSMFILRIYNIVKTTISSIIIILNIIHTFGIHTFGIHTTKTKTKVNIKKVKTKIS